MAWVMDVFPQSKRIYRARIRVGFIACSATACSCILSHGSRSGSGGGKDLAIVRAPELPAIATTHRTFRDAIIKAIVQTLSIFQIPRATSRMALRKC